MTGWIILAVYVLGYLACWRTVTWYIASDMACGGAVDAECLIFGALVGSLLTLFWPAILTGIAAKHIYEHHGEGVTQLIVPRSHKRKVALQERERRIHELEQEVGIR